jgi:anti-sigma regulatory factor (Ser/Thr protein kinase)
MCQITVAAKDDQLDEVQKFVRDSLKDIDCSTKQLFQLDLIVEEIFVNIAHYAYKGEHGSATIKCAVEKRPPAISIEFIDSGIKYNPLEKEDPDISIDAQHRRIGGLGIFLTKKNVEKLEYTYQNGKNCLKLKKFLTS